RGVAGGVDGDPGTVGAGVERGGGVVDLDQAGVVAAGVGRGCRLANGSGSGGTPVTGAGLKPVLVPTPPVTSIAPAFKVEPPETVTALELEELIVTLHPGTLTAVPPLMVRAGCAV